MEKMVINIFKNAKTFGSVEVIKLLLYFLFNSNNKKNTKIDAFWNEAMRL